MVSRAELIARIRVLEQDVVDTLSYGFNATVEKLRILNPGVEFVVEGTWPFNQVIDGKIFYLPECYTLMFAPNIPSSYHIDSITTRSH